MTRSHFLRSTLLCGACLFSLPAFADDVPRANLDAQIDQAFHDVMSAPGDVQANGRYATLLVQSGNFEGAIAALEGQLSTPNADPSIRIQLGVLYYRLASYAAAESYFQAALADPRLSDAQRAEVQNLLKDVAARTAPGGHLNGSVSLGLREQSNPTATSSDDQIRSGGLLTGIPDTTRRKSSVDAFLNGGVQHDWDLGTQNEATLVSNGSVFANHYDRSAPYNDKTTKNGPQDLVAIGGTSGIRFKPAPENLPNLSVRPYVGGSEILLSGSQYMGSVGGGFDTAYTLNGGATLLGATYDLRRLLFADRADVADSAAQSGYEQSLQLSVTQEVAPLQNISASVTLRDHEAGRNFFAYQSVESRVAYGASYTNPLGLDGRYWSTQLYTGPSFKLYEGADASVSPGVTRRDNLWQTGISENVPVADSLSLVFAVDYSTAHSNLENYTYNNLSASTSLRLAF